MYSANYYTIQTFFPHTLKTNHYQQQHHHALSVKPTHPQNTLKSASILDLRKMSTYGSIHPLLTPVDARDIQIASLERELSAYKSVTRQQLYKILGCSITFFIFLPLYYFSLIMLSEFGNGLFAFMWWMFILLPTQVVMFLLILFGDRLHRDVVDDASYYSY
ncbi:hypothetical protein P280DRAFT_334440 [Massarina eburnea CBS 473.64]|uniref:Uncharacterized protein n=1 Tax=Massarina eburnea CBS 473.64 TaxID=1395130 RepID=A0A6A6S3I8_9PLEO|nr:hypothetical protein P280DRAFT_334440 [Massarina eburnea CBS 473.64]